MNSYDIFRKLTKGISFDNNRFQGDLQKIGVKKKNDVNEKEKELPEVKEEEEEKNGIIPDEPEDDFDEEYKSEKDETNIKLFSNRKVKKTKKKKKENKTEQLNIYLKQMRKKRLEQGITVWGKDVPEMVATFDELTERHKINEVLVSNLLNQGYASPTPIQMQSWPLMLQGREILGCAPTGSGKTAAFVLPVLNQLGGPKKKGFRAVILAPTRELAKQIYRECIRLGEGLGLRINIINNVNTAKLKFGPKSSKRFDVLVTTPNRLVFLLREDDTPPLNLSNVEWLVVDESDRLFEGGSHGFRDQLAIIYQACTGPRIKRALFSATFSGAVESWCKLNLDNVAMVTVGSRNSACKDVKQELLFCGNESGKVLALRNILRKGYEPPVLIFVQTKERAADLFKELIYDNIMVEAIHGDRTQQQRDNVVQAFRERKIWVLICTELMSRGIDFKGVNLVINYDFPTTPISYIHRIGRTGRAHHQGRAITFWTTDDKPNLRNIVQVIKNSGQEVPEWMMTLKRPGRVLKKKLKKRLPNRGYISQGVMLDKMEKRKKREMMDERKKRNMNEDTNEKENEGDFGNQRPKNKKRKMNRNPTENGGNFGKQGMNKNKKMNKNSIENGKSPNQEDFGNQRPKKNMKKKKSVQNIAELKERVEKRKNVSGNEQTVKKKVKKQKQKQNNE